MLVNKSPHVEPFKNMLYGAQKVQQINKRYDETSRVKNSTCSEVVRDSIGASGKLPKMIQKREARQANSAHPVKDTNSVCTTVLRALPEPKLRALEGEPRPSGWTSSRRDCGQRVRVRERLLCMQNSPK